ncbi:spore germination protein GerW family protein [Streptomyces sp. R41]|uniref:Spore germination protein GerW family protein n=1 Tax=Streptomyces sp. R41 TaxID=3238632 RepID=A0AB39RNL9_9ACTN
MTAPQDTTPPPDDSTAPLADSVEPAGGTVARLLEGLAERLGGRASVTAVFGEAVTREGVTVIPVAKVGFGFGGGVLRGLGRAKNSEGGGGGGGCGARPLGFIELRDGTATYHPIRDPWADVVAPLAALIVTAAGPVLTRALTRRRKS